LSAPLPAQIAFSTPAAVLRTQIGPVAAPPALLERELLQRHISKAAGSRSAPLFGDAARASQSRLTRTLKTMSRVSSLSSPFLLGFDEIERVLDRVGKGADGYPPYNIERVARDGNSPDRLRITLAVAGFTRDQLDVSIEENQLVIRGRQQDDKSRQYIHRGIAARQFQRIFVLADGMEVQGADLKNGLLSIDLVRPQPERIVKSIAINECD
jgi:HSP20 family molecular chaperone IbpA